MEEIKLQAKVENIPAMTEFTDQKLESWDCGMKAQMQIDVALDELLSNIALYGYPDGPGMMTLQLDLDEESGMLTMTFIDDGIPFNPLAKEDPDITLSAEERGIGGLGIFLVKKTMDSVSYEHKNNQNVLTVVKKIR